MKDYSARSAGRMLLSLCLIFFTMTASAQAPQRDWSTYFGGQLTAVNFVKVDTANQCVIVCGETADSTGIATPGAYKEHFVAAPPLWVPHWMLFWDWDVFIAKFDLEGNLLWSTYYGGVKQNQVLGMDLDRQGNIYIAGITYSDEGIATPGAFQSSVAFSDSTEYAGYLAKFSPEGNLLWGTYYGAVNDVVTSVATDSLNQVYISGRTRAIAGIATAGAWQPFLSGWVDGFIAKFDTDGNRLWGTYYGNYEPDSSAPLGVGGLYVDKDNSLVLAGGLQNAGGSMGTPGVYLQDPPSPVAFSSRFVAKFSSAGVRLWHSYLNGNPQAITGDEWGNYYILGDAHAAIAAGISTPGTYQQDFGGGSRDNYLMKFSNDGKRLWGTLYGGDGSDGISFNGEPDPTHSTGNGKKLAYSSRDGGAIYVSGITDSEIGLENGCGMMTTTANRKGFLGKFDVLGGLDYSVYYDEGIYAMDVHENTAGAQQIFTVLRTGMDSLATPGGFKDNKDGLLRSGLVTKFTENCPLDTVSIQYAAPALQATAGFEKYIWYHNGIAVAYGVSDSWTPTDTSGSYHYVAVNCACRYVSDTFTFVSAPVTVTPVEGGLLSVYPNPVQETLLIDAGGVAPGPAHLTVTDVTGKMVYQEQISVPQQRIQINVAGMANGVYFIKLNAGAGAFISRFVKQ